MIKQTGENIFLKLITDTSELWNERKGLDWSNKASRKRIISRIEKKVNEIKKTLDEFDKELLFLKEFYL